MVTPSIGESPYEELELGYSVLNKWSELEGASGASQESQPCQCMNSPRERAKDMKQSQELSLVDTGNLNIWKSSVQENPQEYLTSKQTPQLPPEVLIQEIRSGPR